MAEQILQNIGGTGSVFLTAKDLSNFIEHIDVGEGDASGYIPDNSLRSTNNGTSKKGSVSGAAESRSPSPSRLKSPLRSSSKPKKIVKSAWENNDVNVPTKSLSLAESQAAASLVDATISETQFVMPKRRIGPGSSSSSRPNSRGALTSSSRSQRNNHGMTTSSRDLMNSSSSPSRGGSSRNMSSSFSGPTGGEVGHVIKDDEIRIKHPQSPTTAPSSSSVRPRTGSPSQALGPRVAWADQGQGLDSSKGQGLGPDPLQPSKRTNANGLQGIANASKAASEVDEVLHLGHAVFMSYRVVEVKHGIINSKDMTRRATKRKALVARQQQHFQSRGLDKDKGAFYSTTDASAAGGGAATSHTRFPSPASKLRSRGSSILDDDLPQDGSRFTLVVVPDLFMTLESLETHLEDLLDKFLFARIVLVGLPGMPNTLWPGHWVLNPGTTHSPAHLPYP